MLEKEHNRLINLHIWMEWRYRICVSTHEANLKPFPEAQNNFWIKNRTEEYMGQLSAGLIN